ncbi:MAG: prepilin-type N-terminal cleavage/methylation domain-containing protein [Nitrosomonadales bacterium]|nr:prepilin-type N-terminal cleavage/methylation domain-containing protein [Nitrosomonadales bacterium]
MKRNQSGFTLIEIAIVLVIIGLLLGGVLKGQELINSAKVKNLAADFKNVPLYIYGYQDKFKALPGDDTLAATHVSGVAATTPAGTTGNGLINGEWNSNTYTHESMMFWQHARLAGLVAGQTASPTANFTSDQDPYIPQNAVGGRVGIESGSTMPPIANLKGSYIVCSSHILGKFAKQLDTTMDDGVPSTGSIMVTNDTTGSTTARASSDAAITNATSVDDATLYTVCMGV